MSFNVTDLIKSLLRRTAVKSVAPSGGAKLSLTKLEDRTVPAVVTIESLGNVTEGTPAAFRLTRTDTSGALDVNVEASGTEFPFGELRAVSFPIGFATIDVTFATTDDSTDDSTSELTKRVTATITTGSDYTIGTPGDATTDVLDNDAQVVSVVNASDAVEGGGNGLVLISRTGSLAQALTVSYAVAGTATPSTDYVPLGGTVQIPAGQVTAVINISVVADQTVEEIEMVSLSFQSGTGYTVEGTGAVDVVILPSVQDFADLLVLNAQTNYDLTLTPVTVTPFDPTLVLTDDARITTNVIDQIQTDYDSVSGWRPLITGGGEAVSQLLTSLASYNQTIFAFRTSNANVGTPPMPGGTTQYLRDLALEYARLRNQIDYLAATRELLHQALLANKQLGMYYLALRDQERAQNPVNAQRLAALNGIVQRHRDLQLNLMKLLAATTNAGNANSRRQFEIYSEFASAFGQTEVLLYIPVPKVMPPFVIVPGQYGIFNP